jgi:hypothetical protein
VRSIFRHIHPALLAIFFALFSAGLFAQADTPSQAQVQQVHKHLKATHSAELTAQEKKEKLRQTMREHPLIFRNSGVDLHGEQPLDAAILHVESLFYKAAVDEAPTPEGKLNVIGDAPLEVREQLEPEGPALIAPLENEDEITFTREKQSPGTAAPPIKVAPATVAKEPTEPAPKAAPKHAAHPRESLTAQASDPTAPLVQAQLTYLYSDVVRNSSGSARQFLIEPVIPIPPNSLVPMTQIIRPTVPFVQFPGGKSGLADIDIQHVFVPEGHDWGTLGFGYTATLPTADHRDLGAGKYSAGPAVTLIYYGIKNWQMGGTMAQAWSFAGRGNRDDVSELTVQPILNYLLGPWYVGIGDFTWEYDWKDSEGWNIPLGLQAGRITKIGKYNYNISAEVLWVPKHSGGSPSPERAIKFGFVLLLPE